MPRKKVVVIGGGITGITCAYFLARSGHEVFVYEKNEYLGGLAATFSANGYAYDYGPHEYCSENPELIALLREVLGDKLLVRSKHTSQFLNSRYVDYPVKPLQLIRVFSPFLLAKIASQVIYQRFKRLVCSEKDYSFKRWVETRFGTTMYEIYFGPYTKKVFGVDPNSLDARKASSRISFNSIFDWLIKTFTYVFLRKDDYSSIHSPLKRKFYYGKGGIGAIPAAIAEHGRRMGVNYCLGEQLERIDRESGKLYFQSGRIHEGFDYLISTIPLPGLLATLGLQEHILPLRFRSMIFIFLEVPQRPVTPYTWIYFPDRDLICQRMTEFNNIEENMAPPGCSALCLEISCFPEDDVWQTSDELIIKRVRQDLDRIGILPKSINCGYHIKRQSHEYPIQRAGYLELIWEMLKPLKKIENIVTTGRQGLFKYCNMNECMEMAIEISHQVDQAVTRFDYSLDTRWRGAGLEEERISLEDLEHPPAKETGVS